MKYEERSVRLTKIQILFSKFFLRSFFLMNNLENPLKDSKKDEYHKDTYRLLIEVSFLQKKLKNYSKTVIYEFEKTKFFSNIITIRTMARRD